MGAPTVGLDVLFDYVRVLFIRFDGLPNTRLVRHGDKKAAWLWGAYESGISLELPVVAMPESSEKATRDSDSAPAEA